MSLGERRSRWSVTERYAFWTRTQTRSVWWYDTVVFARLAMVMDTNLYIKLERDLYDHDVPFDTVIREAYQAGADAELDACCEWLVKNFWLEPRGKSITNLRDARRPKPPSLKAQALEALKHAEEGWRPVPEDCALIRRALEALPD